jgi:hypothetical protein
MSQVEKAEHVLQFHDPRSVVTTQKDISYGVLEQNHQQVGQTV